MPESIYQARKQERERAKKDLRKINNTSHIDKVCFIHYSCESFYPERVLVDKTPRITSIAVRHTSSGQTRSFSIHKIAEIKHIKFGEIEQYYNYLEKEMLYEFFCFVEKNLDYIWVHWNMRDIGYGFQAIEHRYKVLGGKSEHLIKDENKVDLARILKGLYGSDYIEHPRLESLSDKNKIGSKDFIRGEKEADAFENQKYIKMHRSTLKKVRIFEDIISKLRAGNLKTDSKWRDIYGVSIESIYKYCKNNWRIGILIFLIPLIF